MILQGRNITLREPKLADAEQILNWENDEEVQKVGTSGVLYTLDMIKDYIAGIKDVYLDKQLRMMVCLHQIGIGAIDLYDVRLEEATAQVGILIADESSRGKGYGSEALNLITKYATEVLGIKQLFVKIQQDNQASLSFFQKNGFYLSHTEENIMHLHNGITVE